MIHYIFLFNRQRRIRFERWYVAKPMQEKILITDELMTKIFLRSPRACNFMDYNGVQIIYKRYASLFFCCAVDEGDNVLFCLELIYRFVELLDQFFGSVCELDVLYNFERVHFIWDEYILGGEINEPSRLEVLRAVRAQDRICRELSRC